MNDNTRPNRSHRPETRMVRVIGVLQHDGAVRFHPGGRQFLDELSPPPPSPPATRSKA